MALQQWALPQISKLLPLDDDSLKQIVTYSDTLSRDAAAEHLKNLLGDSPQAIDFIAAFNQRRPTPPSEASPSTGTGSNPRADPDAVPRAAARTATKKKNFRSLPPPRQVEAAGDTAGAYRKADLDDYLPGNSSQSRSKDAKPPQHHHHAALANTLSLQSQPDASSSPLPAAAAQSQKHQQQSTKLPPSAAGTVISAAASPKSSRSSSPSMRPTAAKTKVNITGGTAMRGASSALDDLDGAIRALELQTNPTLASASASAEDRARRRCDCMAARHPLLAAAPNCLSCGKVVCAREGLGPCTSCGAPLLSPHDLQDMVRILREERGRERQELNNQSSRRAEAGRQQPRAFAGLVRPGATTSLSSAATSGAATPERSDSSAAEEDGEDGGKGEAAALARARRHRDRLLGFQASNARRTRVHDEAADFETPDAGLSAWASPQERAEQLKRQQRVLREQQWNARPEHERRQMVVSIDVRSGKAVRTLREVERPTAAAAAAAEAEEGDADGFEGDEERAGAAGPPAGRTGGGGGGAFSRNPLLGGLIRPIWKAADADGDGDADNGDKQGKGKGKEGSAMEGEEEQQQQQKKKSSKSSWRRVQDDDDDNEKWILDGGAYGDTTDGRVLAAEERACG